jgi:hypothetical protein
MRFLVLFICLVSVFDIYLTVKYADSLHIFEQNLVARMLIYKEDSPICPATIFSQEDPKIDVSRLVAFKCIGLLAAADILEWMVRKNTRWSLLVIWIMASIQTYLFFYLVA